MTKNIYKVRRSAWSRWSEHGRRTFNTMITILEFGSKVQTWNVAFMAACEMSNLNIEYEPREGWSHG